MWQIHKDIKGKVISDSYAQWYPWRDEPATKDLNLQ
jgi:hypothetical protein